MGMVGCIHGAAKRAAGAVFWRSLKLDLSWGVYYPRQMEGAGVISQDWTEWDRAMREGGVWIG